MRLVEVLRSIGRVTLALRQKARSSLSRPSLGSHCTAESVFWKNTLVSSATRCVTQHGAWCHPMVAAGKINKSSVDALLLCLVPIIPEYLYQMDHPEHAAGNFSKVSAQVMTPTSTSASPIWSDNNPANVAEDDQYMIATTKRPFFSARKQKITSPTSSVTNATTLSPEDVELRHEELVEVNVRVGIMFASKAAMQLIANPFVGHLTNRWNTH